VAANSALTQIAQGYESVYVAPQTGSLLGGGYVRVANPVMGNDENALLASISRVVSVSERELQAQQDLLRLQFGQLCAINAIARGESNNVGQIASLKIKGKTWTESATSKGASISSVAKTTDNTSLTLTGPSNAADRANGGADKIKTLVVHPQLKPGG